MTPSSKGGHGRTPTSVNIKFIEHLKFISAKFTPRLVHPGPFIDVTKLYLIHVYIHGGIILEHPGLLMYKIINHFHFLVDRY